MRCRWPPRGPARDARGARAKLTHVPPRPPPPPPPPSPRACSSFTHRLIHSKDHAAVQISVGHVDAATGRYTGTSSTFALCGYIRDKVRRRGGEQ
jgi:hypothetical protein